MEKSWKSTQIFSDRYLKSRSAKTLAALKGIEGIFAALAIIEVVDSLSRYINYAGMLPAARFLSNINLDIEIIIDYTLTILSSVGFIVLVLARKCAGMVRFSHKFKFIIGWIAIILIGCVYLFSGSLLRVNSWITLIQSVAATVLLICYNRYVCIIMKNISVEVKRNRPSPMASTKINLCCYFLMAIYTSDIIIYGFVWGNYTNTARYVFYIVKYFFVTVFVRKMAAEHSLYHEESSENLQE